MPWGLAAAAVATVVAGAVESGGAETASGELQDGYNNAQGEIKNIQSQNVSNITSNEANYTAAGNQAVSQLQSGTAPGGNLATNFSLADLNVDPGYQFDLQQGNQAVQRSAAATGTLNSGGTLKSIANYTTGLASNEINNAYNRYTTDQNNQYSRLYNLAGLGQTATNAVNAADTNQANVTSNATENNVVGAAGANAAGTVASSNAIGGSIMTLGSLASGNAAQLFGSGTGSSYMPSSSSNPSGTPLLA